MVKSRIRLDKKDHLRALLTDTAPTDVPLIFSNDGLYVNCHRYSETHVKTSSEIFPSLFKNVLSPADRQSAPYKYAIHKSEISLRMLSLIHPRAQLSFCQFYNDYREAIVYLCSRSRSSIRAPYKVSNSYYARDSDKMSHYKDVDIDTLENELNRKHAASYFSYRGHNRLYKFFGSPAYLSMEKRFPFFWTLDVSRCFDSIYTHTVSWAVKGKAYARQNIPYKNQFSAEFDRLMQRSNNNETNGIPVGSEVSRIFAEVIFQSVDADIDEIAREQFGYQPGVQYEYFRYVDDYFLFAKSNEVASNVSRAISEALEEYNLYIGDHKLRKSLRPFSTEKSKAISRAKKLLSDFEGKTFHRSNLDEGLAARPKKINRPYPLIRSFIEEVKGICDSDAGGYLDVSSYLIAALSNRVIALLDDYRRNSEDVEDAEKLACRDLVVLCLRLKFFLFSVGPEVVSSYKLAKTIAVADKFFVDVFPEFSAHYRTAVMDEIQNGLDFSGVDEVRGRRVSLESLNILLATSEFGSNYLVSDDRLFELMKHDEASSYFSLISLLFYARDHDQYARLRTEIERRVVKALAPGCHVDADSESAHLFLDVLSCPYVSAEARENVLWAYLNKFEQSLNPTPAAVKAMLEALQSVFWFVKWQGLDLIKLLMRKELNGGY